MIIANARYLQSKDAHFKKIDFYVKRFARIYPMYFLALLLLAIFHYFIKSIDTPTVKYRLIFETLGIQRWFYFGSFNFPGWTISCEFFFYLLFPAAIIALKKNYTGFKVFAWTYLIIAYTITLCLYFINTDVKNKIEKAVVSGLHLNPLFLISIFLIGMLCGKAFIDNNIPFFKNKINSLVTVLICIPAIFFVKYYLPDYLLDCGLLSPVYFIFILAITSFPKGSSSFFSNKIFIFLGDISYSIYIFQLPVWHYYAQYVSDSTSWVNIICFTLTLIAFCSIIYYALEIPVKNYILTHFNRRRALKESDIAVL